MRQSLLSLPPRFFLLLLSVLLLTTIHTVVATDDADTVQDLTAATPFVVQQQETSRRVVSLSNGRKSQCQYLWGKKHTVIMGSLCLEVDQRNPEQLIVSYVTAEGWKLDQAHLWVGRNVTEIPMKDDGAVDLDKFTYTKKDLHGQHTHFGFVVKLWYLDFTCPDSKGTQFFGAAHATMSARSAVRHGKEPTVQSTWASLKEEPSLDFDRKYLDFEFTLTCDLLAERPKGSPTRHHANQIPK